MSSHLCRQVCVWSFGAGWVMTMACLRVGPWCTVMGADNVFGGKWTALARVAVMGSPSVGVMVASPWIMGRVCWWSAGSVQVSLGWVIEWRRMAWSPVMVSPHRSVPLLIAQSCSRFRNSLRSGVVRCCGGSFISVMGCARGSWWGCSCAAGGSGTLGISSFGCRGA